MVCVLVESVGFPDSNGIYTFTNVDIWEQIGDYVSLLLVHLSAFSEC